jgi:hypothetical protein
MKKNLSIVFLLILVGCAVEDSNQIKELNSVAEADTDKIVVVSNETSKVESKHLINDSGLIVRSTVKSDLFNPEEVINFEYSKGQLIKMSTKNTASGITTQKSFEYNSEYDSNNNVLNTSVTVNGSEFETIRFVYNESGKLIGSERTDQLNNITAKSFE